MKSNKNSQANDKIKEGEASKNARVEKGLLSMLCLMHVWYARLYVFLVGVLHQK